MHQRSKKSRLWTMGRFADRPQSARAAIIAASGKCPEPNDDSRHLLYLTSSVILNYQNSNMIFDHIFSNTKLNIEE